MKRITITTSILLFLCTTLRGQDVLDGAWTAREANGRFWISMSADSFGWHRSEALWLADLPSGEIRMEIRRDAGTIVLEGTRKDDKAAGFFTFTPNWTFNDRIAQYETGPFDLKELFVLTTLDASVSEVERLHGLGYTRLKSDDLFAMFIHDALSDHIQAMAKLGYTDLSVDDLLSTRIHDVTPDFIAAVKALELRVESLDQLVAMRIHDVTPEYVRSIRELGYPDVTIDDLIGMRIHDVTPEYVRLVNDLMDERR